MSEEKKEEQKGVISVWQVEQHYFPALIGLDTAISNIERLIWDNEYPKHQNGAKTSEAILSPSYSDAAQLAFTRNRLLETRNHFAGICGIKSRGIHDNGEGALGYKIITGIVYRLTPQRVGY